MTEPKHFNYQAEAAVTMSDSFFGEFVGRTELYGALLAFSVAAARLDEIKKRLFYGRGIENLPVLTPEDSIESIDAPWTGHEEQVAHSIIGMATESGELIDGLIESLKQKYVGSSAAIFDYPNLAEETGDVLWYVAAMANVTGISIEEMMRVNIAKLRKRYPHQFTEYDANNRDLQSERVILESVQRTLPGIETKGENILNNSLDGSEQ